MGRVVAALVLAAAFGCTSKEGAPVTLMKAPVGRPALDAALPARIETATFAVG